MRRSARLRPRNQSTARPRKGRQRAPAFRVRLCHAHAVRCCQWCEAGDRQPYWPPRIQRVALCVCALKMQRVPCVASLANRPAVARRCCVRRPVVQFRCHRTAVLPRHEHTRRTRTRTHTHTHTHTRTHTRTRTRTHTRTHTFTHPTAHTRTRTMALALSRPAAKAVYTPTAAPPTPRPPPPPSMFLWVEVAGNLWRDRRSVATSTSPETFRSCNTPASSCRCAASTTSASWSWSTWPT